METTKEEIIAAGQLLVGPHYRVTSCGYDAENGVYKFKTDRYDRMKEEFEFTKEAVNAAIRNPILFLSAWQLVSTHDDMEERLFS